MRYTAGTTVQGKRRTKSYKIHKVEAVPKEEWIKVENTHEAIIDKELFKKAQELNKKDTRVSQKTKKLSIWAGFLKCSDCKRAMNKKSSTNKSGKTYEYYICSTYRKKSNKLCTKHTIKVENLKKAVLETINFHIDLLIDINEVIEEVDKSTFKNIKNESIEKIIKAKQNEISKLSNFKLILYKDWKNAYITQEEYFEYKQKYVEDIKRLKQNIKILENEKQKLEEKKQLHNKKIKEFEMQRGIKELSRDIMMELIECIYVHENGNITIKFSFKDEFKNESIGNK